jgi:hypothetical protein
VAVPYEAAVFVGVLKPGIIEESKMSIMRTGKAMDARSFKPKS